KTKTESFWFLHLLLHAAMTKRHFCTLPPESGHCRAYVPSWYYDPSTHSCKVFVYGGCGGNGNRFYTMQQCQEVCCK
ncbi:Kunitz domain-containing protein, putative, partial [Ixodes scapularis]